MAVLGGDVLEGKIRAKEFWLFRVIEEEGEKVEKQVAEGKIDSVQIGQKIEHEIGAGTECGMKVTHKDFSF